MEGDADSLPDRHADRDADDPSSVKARFDRVKRLIQKPKPGEPARPFQGITNDEKQRRMQLVRDCVSLGMSIEQMVDFLPTWDLTLSRSTLYEYLGVIRLPRSYKRSESEQSHHDYFTWRFFIRIAQDAFARGFRTKKLLKGTLAWPGMRFKPDFKFEVATYLFFMEMQLSDLTETRWFVKFSNYHRLFLSGHIRFRVLFIIDQKNDLSYVRAGARRFLEGKRSGRNLFLFICLSDLKGSANVAVDPVWMDPWGDYVSLLQWASL